MIPEEIDRRVQELVVGGVSGDPLRALEEMAERSPGDRRIAALVVDLSDRRSAESSTPPIVAGVRREELVRFDAFSVTWVGTEVATGRGAMVRVLRGDRRIDPALARSLVREGRALASVLDVVVDATTPALVLSLEHPPLTDAPTARHLVGALVDLQRWADAGIAAPPLGALELRDAGGRGAVCCLTLGATPDETIPSLHARLRPRSTETPSTLEEAKERTRAAFALQLTELFHALGKRVREGVFATRAARLHATVRRLQESLPPPLAAARLGDVVLRSDGTTVQLGDEIVFSRGALVAPLARQLLRAHASAPPERHGEADRVGRWVAAALKLRTVRLLLER
jgi:hypothetical protein